MLSEAQTAGPGLVGWPWPRPSLTSLTMFAAHAMTHGDRCQGLPNSQSCARHLPDPPRPSSHAAHHDARSCCTLQGCHPGGTRSPQALFPPPGTDFTRARTPQASFERSAAPAAESRACTTTAWTLGHLCLCLEQVSCHIHAQLSINIESSSSAAVCLRRIGSCRTERR
jgi:hypothetical protein